MDQLELQKRLPIVRQALRNAQGNTRERGRLAGLCLAKKVISCRFRSFRSQSIRSCDLLGHRMYSTYLQRMYSQWSA
jgi:hypothetical protein